MIRLALLNLVIWGGASALALSAVDLARRPPPAPLAAPAPSGVPAAPERAIPLPDPRDFGPIAARPLFAPSRRPQAPPEVAEPIQPPALALVGVAGVGEARVATFRDAAGDSLRLGPGGRIHGWTISRIEPRRATVTRGGEIHAFILGDLSPLEDPDARQARDVTTDRRSISAPPPRDPNDPMAPYQPIPGMPFFDPNPTEDYHPDD